MPDTPVIDRRLPVGGAPDILRPYLAASSLVAISARVFGSRAATLAAFYAIEARQCRRDGDYRLWLTVFKHHLSLAHRTS